MAHFVTAGRRVRLGLSAVGDGGLREAQVGALLALAAHSTASTEPAQAILPTGVGKTVIATLAPYVLAANRVLVVVPGRLIRGQMQEAFANPTRARAAGVLPANSGTPRVVVAEHRAKASDWNRWRRSADVVIGTPSVLSPSNDGVDAMPRDLFDLVIFDEAHHLPATTWTGLLDATDARAVLLTATPFRNDGKRLPGRPAYTYLLARAIEEGVFGPVSYVPVDVLDDQQRDLSIAIAASTRLNSPEHIAAGSRLLVRTDSVEHARALVEVYASIHTHLSLIVHDTPWQEAQQMRAHVVSGDSMGFVCVGALTEGFDFPALKVGAYHAPHKTLGPTIQFIGRLARVGDIAGVLFAPRDAVTEETSALYREDVAWQTLLPDLVDSAIDREQQIRTFVDRATSYGPLDLPPLSLTPPRRVEIFLTNTAPDLTQELRQIGSADVVQRIVHDDSRTIAFVTRRVWRPEFLRLDTLDVPIHELHLLTWVEGEGVLFLSTTTASAGRDILQAVAPAPRTPLPSLELRRLLEAANMDRYFSIGTRAAQPQAMRTSYQVRSGPKTEDDITPADGRQWDLGHGIGRSGAGTFGFSVQKSKIWEPGAADSLFAFRRWCEGLSRALRDQNLGHQQSRLDLLSIPDALVQLPQDPLLAALPPEIYVGGQMLVADGQTILPELFEARPRVPDSSSDVAVFDIFVRDQALGEARFTRGGIWQIAGVEWSVRSPGDPDLPLAEVLLHEPATIFFADGSRVTGTRVSAPPATLSPVAADIRQPRAWANTLITAEWGDPGDGRLSVGPTVAADLSADARFVLQDHARGELADFIAVVDGEQEPTVCLVHCKSSARAAPAARVEDVQELVAQAIRSVCWLAQGPALWEELLYRLANRPATHVIAGDANDVTNLLTAYAQQPPRARWSVEIVQPGLSDAALDTAPRVTSLLNAAHAWVASQQAAFSVICSV